MAGPRRYLYLPDFARSRDSDFAAAQEEAFAACPAAAAYSDHEVEDFLSAAFYLDHGDRMEITDSLRRARIAIPPELTFDEYRLTRYLFRRWRDPGVSEAFLQRGIQLDWGRLAQLRRRGQTAELVTLADFHGVPVALATLRRYGMGHLIPVLLEAISPEEKARHRALMLHGRLLLHRCLTEPEPPRRPSRWEQQKLTRRLQLREVQLRAMRRSRHRLRRERKQLIGRLRSAGQNEQPELAGLAKELAALQAQRVAARRRHETAAAQQTARCQSTISRLQAELAATRQDHARTLAERAQWLPLPRR